MNRKRLLTGIVVVIALAGVALAAVPFVRAMSLNPKAVSAAPHIDAAGLLQGQYRFVNVLGEEPSSRVVLLLRDFDGGLHVYSLWQYKGRYMMPDRTWDHYAGYCDDLRPDGGNGQLVKGGVISCRDSDDTRRLWRWNYAGKSLTQDVANLHEPKFWPEGMYVVLGSS